ncbi:MAG: toll/interleukin-1 receptor domain-containing protein [Armatimonadota bacterium]
MSKQQQRKATNYTFPSSRWSVFISHGYQDHKFAEELSKLLNDRGINTWLDTTNIQPGDNWIPAVTQAISGCNVALLIVSPSSIKSPGALREWSAVLTRFWNEKRNAGEPIRIIPLLLRTDVVPEFAKSIGSTVLRADPNDPSAAADSLIDSLAPEQQSDDDHVSVDRNDVEMRNGRLAQLDSAIQELQVAENEGR